MTAHKTTILRKETIMAEFYQEAHTRGQQTLAIWLAWKAALTVDVLTRTQHMANVAALFTAAQARDNQQDVLDAARAARTTNFTFLQDVSIRFPRALEGQLPAQDQLHGDIEDIRNVEPVSQEAAMDRVRKVIPLLTTVNARRALLVPPPGDITIAAQVPTDPDLTLAAVQAALTAHPGRLQTVEDEIANLKKARRALQDKAELVDTDNKRWFGAWEGFFPAGSPARDALTQIDTGPTTPVPSPLLIHQFTAAGGGAAHVTYVAGGGAHASTLLFRYKIVGVDNDFVHQVLVVLTGQTISGLPVGATIEGKVRASNSKGDTDSPVVSVVVT